MSSQAGFAYIWRYRVDQQERREFEALYGPGGGWERLFSRSKEYLGTELLKSPDGSYVTVDRWTSRHSHRAFVKENRQEFDALDRRGEALTRQEELIGEFTVL